MTQEFGPERGHDFTSGSVLSRRAMLRWLAATAIPATGAARAGHAFANAGPAITPFSYRAPQSALDDLRQRLGRTRWPEGETVADWSQGVPLAKLRPLVEDWRTGYDWRRCEATLNGFAQYRTEIDGLGIHFLHVRSLPAEALPILITHGWPGSVPERPCGASNKGKRDEVQSHGPSRFRERSQVVLRDSWQLQRQTAAAGPAGHRFLTAGTRAHCGHR
jgi:hypothetical protein